MLQRHGAKATESLDGEGNHPPRRDASRVPCELVALCLAVDRPIAARGGAKASGVARHAVAHDHIEEQTWTLRRLHLDVKDGFLSETHTLCAAEAACARMARSMRHGASWACPFPPVPCRDMDLPRRMKATLLVDVLPYLLHISAAAYQPTPPRAPIGVVGRTADLFATWNSCARAA